jgi:Fur family transcriptional regulator, ferric uptake regulator
VIIDYREALRCLRMKATPKRIAILEILAEKPIYLNPEEVWIKMKERFNRIGLPTIYRNLEDLCQSGLLISVLHSSHKLHYFFCPNPGHHHHFVCLSCRIVQDIEYCGAQEIEEEVVTALGGKVLSHFLQVHGFCQTCLSKEMETCSKI